jgi:hypothetical protein
VQDVKVRSGYFNDPECFDIDLRTIIELERKLDVRNARREIRQFGEC